MVREAVKIEPSDAQAATRRYTVASNAAIVIGTFLTLSDPRTVASNTTTGAIFAGFAAMEKKNDDYSIAISAYTDGIFKCTASGAIAVGDLLKTAAPGNYVMTWTGTLASNAIIVGKALETAADEDTLLVELNVRGVTYL